MKSIKVELLLDTGFAECEHREVVEVNEDECNLDDQKAINKYLDKYVVEWAWDYISVSYNILKKNSG